MFFVLTYLFASWCSHQVFFEGYVFFPASDALRTVHLQDKKYVPSPSKHKQRVTVCLCHSVFLSFQSARRDLVTCTGHLSRTIPFVLRMNFTLRTLASMDSQIGFSAWFLRCSIAASASCISCDALKLLSRARRTSHLNRTLPVHLCLAPKLLPLTIFAPFLPCRLPAQFTLQDATLLSLS